MKLISNKPLSGTILTHEDGWVSIGNGLEVLLPPGVQNGDSWKITIKPYTTPTHLGNAQISDTIAISSESQLLSLIQGNTVYTENSTSLTFDYSDKPSQPQVNHRSPILETLYNHIFLARGRTLWWTDLDNYWNWYPSPESEADFRTFEWEKHDITGITKLNDVLFVHFPKMIYAVEYIGKPTIVRIKALVHGVGAINHRSISTTQSMMFFIGLDNFYAYSLQGGLSPIGNEVWERFVQSTPDFQSIWSYIDTLHNEICWVSGDLIWAFSLSGKFWTKYSSNSILDHTTVPWYSSHSLINPSDETTLSSFDKVNPIGAENLYLTSEKVCRDQREGDDLSKCLELKSPFLETDDITYGDIHFHKRVDLVLLDGSYDFPWMGVRVWVSGRDYISEKKKWVNCGVWTQDKKSKQLDFPAVSGRVLKYRFELLSDLDLGAGFDGGVRLDGRRPDVCDGRFGFDGVEDLMPRQIPVLDGVYSWDGFEILHPRNEVFGVDGQGVMHPVITSPYTYTDTTRVLKLQGCRLNWFDLAAWGERVDLPQVVTGPDK